MSNNMLLLCGQPVYMYRTTRRVISNLSTTTYTQCTQLVDCRQLYAFLYTSFTHANTQKCMQFQSVNYQLSPLYTAPIIRTIKG